MILHHIALRVPDTQAAKAWFASMLDFKIDREFDFNDLSFIWMKSSISGNFVIELIGKKDPFEDIKDKYSMKDLNSPGLHHICFEVGDVKKAVRELKEKGLDFFIESMTGAEGSGVREGAFFIDPWGNSYEILEMI